MLTIWDAVGKTEAKSLGSTFPAGSVDDQICPTGKLYRSSQQMTRLLRHRRHAEESRRRINLDHRPQEKKNPHETPGLTSLSLADFAICRAPGRMYL